MTTDLNHRNTCLRYGQVASIIGTSVIFVAFATYDHTRLFPFRVLTFTVALISWWLLRYTGLRACAISTTDDGRPILDTEKLEAINTAHASQSQSSTSINATVHPTAAASNSESPTPLSPTTKHQARSSHSFLEVALQVIRNRNFVVFILMNFLQVFDVTVSAGFFVIYERHLLGDNAWPASARMFVIGASFLLPQVFVFSVTPLVAKWGSYRVIMYTFVLKSVVSLLVFTFCNSEVTLLVALFMIFNRAIPQGTFSLFSLPLADIVDADVAINNRPHSMSSTIFGLNALFTKPAQSIGPMIVFWFLSRAGYAPHAENEEHVTPDRAHDLVLRKSMFATLCIVPFILGVLQILIWSQYKLRVTDNRRPLQLH
eukprot:m.749147 g.749147  ORF g.749147 m.749147 type:complete len:372 (+) comp58974_c0_seq40:783-1898(+)